MVFQRFVALFTDPELGDHRQVNEGERHQRAEVNQRRRRDEVEFNRQQRNCANQQHVPRRSPPFRMHVAEEARREHAVAAHHVHQAGNARVRGHAGRQYGDAGENQHAPLEGFARHVQHDFRLRCVRILKARDIREVQLQEVGSADKDQAANQRGQEDSLRDHALCVFGLFRQRRDTVEAEEREAQNGRAGNHRHHVRAFRPERTGAGQRARAFAVHNAVDNQANNHRHDAHLQDNDQGVEVRHGLDAAQVGDGHKGHQRDNEDPRWNRRHQRFKVNFRQQNVDHRHEQVVQQR